MRSLIFFSAVLANIAWAAPQSDFAQLNTIFENSTLPVAADLEGWWSGRCFNNLDQGKAFGSVLISKNGAIANVNQNGVNEVADRFDNLSRADEQALSGWMATEGFLKLTATVENGSLVSSNPEQNQKTLVRQYRNYFILQLQFMTDAHFQKASDVYVSCLFNKKIRD